MQTTKNDPNLVSLTPNQGQPSTVPGTTSEGFSNIPTRIKDLAPLVMEEASAEIRAQVLDSLQELSTQVAVIHRNAAEAYLSQNLYEEALPHLQAAVTFAPEVLEYRNQLGFVQFIAGQDEAATESFRTVLSRNPKQVDALFNLGMVLFGAKDYLQAEDCFRRSLESNPDDAETWNNRGACLFQAGRTADAEVCFRRALELDPNNEDAKVNLAST